MSEIIDGTIRAEIEHLKSDILEIKDGYKELSRDMTLKYSELSKDVSSMKESHIETKIYVRQIQDSQSVMAKETKTNQESMMAGIQDLREKPIKNYNQIKIGVWIFAVTYVLGSIFGVMRAFAK